MHRGPSPGCLMLALAQCCSSGNIYKCPSNVELESDNKIIAAGLQDGSAVTPVTVLTPVWGRGQQGVMSIPAVPQTRVMSPNETELGEARYRETWGAEIVQDPEIAQEMSGLRCEG